MENLRENKPTADILMTSMRAMGYSFESAIADIIDNSISASAHNIWLRFPIDPLDCYIAICDDDKCFISYMKKLLQNFKNNEYSFRISEYLSGEELKKAISSKIKEKNSNLVGNMASQGTTPRQLTDLIGSLCDLTSGSGDKGTPIILVQGYFDNFTD